MPRQELQRIVATFTLSEPIEAWGETTTELRFRKPTAGDLWNGLPFRMAHDEAGTTQVFVAIPEMMHVVSKLAGIPLSAVKSMSSPDFNEMVGVIIPLLVGEREEKEERRTFPTVQMEPEPQPLPTPASPPPAFVPSATTTVPSPAPSRSPGGGVNIPPPFLRSA